MINPLYKAFHKGVRDLSQFAMNEDENDDEQQYEEQLTDVNQEIREAGTRVDLLNKQLDELNIVPGLNRYQQLRCAAHKARNKYLSA